MTTSFRCADPSFGGQATSQGAADALERREIERALADCDGNKSHAAERLGLSRQGLLNKLARFGLR
ncbi:MAG: helix-turn-helix domain-containing protein [Myxococcaceae bacterium]